MNCRGLWGHGFAVRRVVLLSACVTIGCGESAGEGGSGGSRNAGGSGISAGAGSSGGAGSSAGGGNANGGGGNGSEALHPPATIDVKSCIQFINPDTAGCLSCCSAAGFMSAGFSFKNACVCGPSGSSDTAVCAGKLETQVSCAGCCGTAGYKYGAWTSGVSCACNIKQNAAVCVGATQAADSCAICCLNSGFLGHDDPAEHAGGCVCVE